MFSNMDLIAGVKALAEEEGLKFDAGSRSASISLPVIDRSKPKFKWMLNDPSLTALGDGRSIELNAHIFHGSKTFVVLRMEDMTLEEFQNQFRDALVEFKVLVAKVAENLQPLLVELAIREEKIKALENLRSDLYNDAIDMVRGVVR